jgi:Flp pilus assembly protein TadG
MISSLKRLWRDRRGNSLAIAGAALPLVLGSAGLASDTIQWTLWKRQLQRAADSGAMAGVYAKSSGNAVGTCTDIPGANYQNPVAYDIKKNLKLKIPPDCTVTNPPSSGTCSSDGNAVRVALEVQRKLSFSGLFMSTAPTIRATALATVVPSGTYCVVSLEDQAVTGINATGSTDVDLGCGMITNSTSMSAAVATGSSEVTATPIAAVGGIPASTHWGTGTVLQPFTLAQDDPFGTVPAPAAGDFPTGPCPNVTVNPNTSATLDPGCYGNLDFKGTVTLNPGVYILDAGTLSTSAQANVSCNGCTFVLTNRSTSPTATIGGVQMNGGANIDLVAPTSGTYEGILIYQDRRAAVNNTQTVNGNSSSKFEGALYFPRAELTFNGTSGMNTNCLQIVSKRVNFTGNSAVNNLCPTGSGASSFAGKRIRLVE